MLITMGVIVGGVVSTYLRSASNPGDAIDVGLDDAAVLLLLASPSLLSVYLSRRWRIWLAECGLAVLAWVMFLGPAGDLSCTDCGFALLIPLYLAVPQAALFLAALLSPKLRESGVARD